MTHGDVKAVTAIGVRSGLYTVVAPSLNQPGLEALGEELRAAHQKGVGVMAMKTMRGLGLGLQAPYLKQILRNPAISSVLKSIGSYEVFDAYQKAIHEPLTAQEARVLYAHAEANRANNCMMCDECKRACPRGVEVSTVLRCHDYYYGQMGDLETAVSTYSAIPSQKLGSAECRLCAKCEIACPNGIQIVKRLDAARDLFAQLA
jgi:hypothetical protein